MQRRLRVALIVIVILVLLTGGVWLAVRQSGLSQPKHWDTPQSAVAVPVISTRGLTDDGRLTGGAGAPAYRVEGALAGWDGTPALADLLVVIHGFNNTPEKAVYKFDIARESLAGADYPGALAGYSWDANTQHDPLSMTGYHAGKRNAAANGALLAQFVRDYAARNPTTRIHLLGYSMGARVALEGLLALDAADPAPQPPLIVSVFLVGAAVGNDEVEQDARYGSAIARQTGTLINYYSPEDNKLGYYFPLKEGGRALGVTDVEHPGRQPANYTAVDAAQELPKFTSEGTVDEDEYGDNHSGYLGTRDAAGKLIDDGVMDLVAARIVALAQPAEN